MKKTTIPKEAPDAQPQAGARQPRGKSSACDAVLLGHDPGTRPSESVTTVKEVAGAAKKAIDTQVNGDGNANGNPKKRSVSSWGRKKESDT